MLPYAEIPDGAWHCARCIAKVLSFNAPSSPVCFYDQPTLQAKKLRLREFLWLSKITQLQIVVVEFEPTFFWFQRGFLSALPAAYSNSRYLILHVRECSMTITVACETLPNLALQYFSDLISDHLPLLSLCASHMDLLSYGLCTCLCLKCSSSDISMAHSLTSLGSQLKWPLTRPSYLKYICFAFFHSTVNVCVSISLLSAPFTSPTSTEAPWEERDFDLFTAVSSASVFRRLCGMQ